MARVHSSVSTSRSAPHAPVTFLILQRLGYTICLKGQRALSLFEKWKKCEALYENIPLKEPQAPFCAIDPVTLQEMKETTKR